MPKYEIKHYCGNTKLYIDGKEIKGLKELKFERNSPEELAKLTIKVIAQEVNIEADNLILDNEEITSNSNEIIS